MEWAELRRLRAALLDWYDENRRELPWRAAPGESADPYRVWLSEVMLQQTRVETVRPYFTRWLSRFPTLQALSEASLDEVLKGWEGLGYYSRARNFHRAVREVVQRYGGEIPRDPGLFRSLPGVGRYTAGAVMSIAFDRPEPVVDGNVRRVFARLLDDPSPAEATLWELAGRVVHGDRPGDLNQALMELGAIVCTPRAPSCATCPAADHCRARAAGTQLERPAPRQARELPVERLAVLVARGVDGTLLVVRRPDRGRLGGLWEFPAVHRRERESVEEGAWRAAAECCKLRIRPVRELGRVTHTFTHVRVHYDAFLAEADPRGRMIREADGPRWATRAEIDKLALPRAQRRILGLVPEAPEMIAPAG